MDRELQRILVDKLQRAGGKMEKDDLYRDRDVILRVNRDKDPTQWSDPIKNTDDLHSKIDHNLSLLEDDGKIKMYRNPAAIMGTTGMICELTSGGYMKPDERTGKLQAKIDEMEDLKSHESWGAKYKIWNNLVEKLLEKDFGEEALRLFKQQTSVDISDEGFVYEVDQRKILLESFLANADEYKPTAKEKDKAAVPSSVSQTSPVTIHNSSVHFGSGHNVGSNSNFLQAAPDIPLWLKWLVAVAAVLVLLWGIYTYFFPNSSSLGMNLIHSPETGMATSTINISDILTKLNGMNTSLEAENFLKNYTNTNVYGSGSFENIAQPAQDFIVTISVSGGEVSCDFDFSTSTQESLLLLQKGQKIAFTGIFTGDTDGDNGGWYVSNCALTS